MVHCPGRGHPSSTARAEPTIALNKDHRSGAFNRAWQQRRRQDLAIVGSQYPQYDALPNRESDRTRCCNRNRRTLTCRISPLCF